MTVQEIAERVRRAEYRVDPDEVARAIVARLGEPLPTLPRAASEEVLVAGELGVPAYHAQA